MNNTVRTIMVWLVIGVILTMVFMQVGNRATNPNILDYSTFLDEARQGRIAKVKMDSNRTIKAVSKDGKTYTVYTPGILDPWMVSDLIKVCSTIVSKVGLHSRHLLVGRSNTPDQDYNLKVIAGRPVPWFLLPRR